MAQDLAGNELSRRDFIKTSTAASLAALALARSKVFAEGSDTIRLGFVGCGDRGTEDTKKCLAALPGVELVAMGDLFRESIDRSLEKLRQKHADKIKVTEETIFLGFDAYKNVLACDIDLVMLTTPPHFRPQHLRAAIAAGKHVFVEKPVAVDPIGVRHVIESAALADEKNLTILAGTQIRRLNHWQEAVPRLHNGAIGAIRSVQCFRIGGAMKDWYEASRVRRPQWSDMEWQLRRWLFVNWLSGDFVTEQHVHNLDLVNWVLGGPPEKCFAQGGRIARTEPEFGNIYDHMSAELVYPGNIRVHYMGSQIDGASGRNYLRFSGEGSEAYLDFGNFRIEGNHPYKWQGEANDPDIDKHAAQIKAIREGTHLNEGKQIAESSLTAIMVRMSAYTGREISWKWVLHKSMLDLTPPHYEMKELTLAPVAVPGREPLI